MTEKQHSTSKTVAKIEARHGAEAAIVRSDVIASHRLVNDTIKDLLVAYQDPEGNTSSSPNSYMTLKARKDARRPRWFKPWRSDPIRHASSGCESA